MDAMTENDNRKSPDTPKLIRNFLIEMVVYGGLVVIYFFVVLRLLGNFLSQLFSDNLSVYAVVALILIVAQGVLLDFLTTFLLDNIKLERLE
jgi:uncharacterized membrane protein